MDFTNVELKYPKAFGQYIKFAIMYSCKVSGVSIASSDLMDTFFDNHNLFPCIEYNMERKQFSFHAGFLGHCPQQYDAVARIEVKGVMYSKCFHLLEQRLEKNM